METKLQVNSFIFWKNKKSSGIILPALFFA